MKGSPAVKCGALFDGFRLGLFAFEKVNGNYSFG